MQHHSLHSRRRSVGSSSLPSRAEARFVGGTIFNILSVHSPLKHNLRCSIEGQNDMGGLGGAMAAAILAMTGKCA